MRLRQSLAAAVLLGLLGPACTASSSATAPGTLQAEIAMPISAGTPVYTAGKVFVPDNDHGGLIEIDTATNSVVRRIPVGDRTRLIASGCQGYTVHQLTPGSFLVRACDLPIAAVAGPDGLWIARNDAGAVERLDPATGRSLALIPAGLEPWDLAATADQVWVTDDFHGGLARIDPAGGRLVTVLSGLPAGESGVATGYGSVWVANSKFGLLYKVDPRTNSVVDTLHLGDAFSRPLPVLAAFGSVWVRLESAQRLVRIDPTGDRVLASIPVGIFAGRDGEDALAADAGGIWVSGLRTEHVSAAANRIDRKLGWSSGSLAVGGGSLWALELGGPLRRISL